jgi:hypothetical protein
VTSTPCSECRFCIQQDEGYSNYTVEGVTIQCAKGLHPDGDFDRWYGEDKRLRNVEDCPGFVSGEPLWIDVDRDNISEFTAEEQEVYALLSNRA